MLKGLEEVAKECESLNIHFHLLLGEAKEVLPKFVKENNVGGVITDFSPLRVPRKWASDVVEKLPVDVPFCQVDAHNIVPCWVASDKQEYGARTIRRKIHDKLKEFLTSFPPVIKQEHFGKCVFEPIKWDKVEETLTVNMDVGDVAWAKPGTTAGLLKVADFCKNRLKYFSDLRNDPTKDNLSNLSPWFHFGAYDWAKKTLKEHVKDKREYLYSREQLENSKTHDLLLSIRW